MLKQFKNAISAANTIVVVVVVFNCFVIIFSSFTKRPDFHTVNKSSRHLSVS